MVASALTTAKPMRWVNETLPPRLRLRWLLITMRLSMSSFAGTARTLVAVGTWRLASMFVTTRAEAPRRGRMSSSVAGSGVLTAAGEAALLSVDGAALAAGDSPAGADCAGADWAGADCAGADCAGAGWAGGGLDGPALAVAASVGGVGARS